MNYREAKKLQKQMNAIMDNGLDVEDISNFFFDLLNEVDAIVSNKEGK